MSTKLIYKGTLNAIPPVESFLLACGMTINVA